ncbi:four helix bundle protein [Crateriforma conspicua]|uniref:Four helix bundle protein n=1 Tax=Crateriforma conspicua TaxID=2527996 RepID=A0A5C5Y929_9PLAN|nr:four helix bundle protein [Crateriforma conspicua]TWT69872.1 hypothetical protein Pan14r_21680 [Crateriforma conspicua]
MAQTYEDLEVWKRACRLAVYVYQSFDRKQPWGLQDQMQRSAVSIASNIAEGYERTTKDFIRFLTIAKGSAAELRTQALIAGKVNELKSEQAKHIADEAKVLSKMLQSLIQYRSTQIRESAEDYAFSPGDGSLRTSSGDKPEQS